MPTGTLKQPLRVLELGPGFEIGGVGQFTITLAQALNRHAITPVLAGLWAYGTPLETQRITALETEGFEVWIGAQWRPTLGAGNVYTAWRGLYRQLRQTPVDIIHSHTEFGDFAALLLKWATGTPIVLRTLHNHEWRRRPLLRPWAKLLYPLTFDCEIGISSHVQAELNARWLARLAQRRALQFNNALPLARFEKAQVDRMAYYTQLGLSTNMCLVGSVGRLSEQKGYDVLLQAWAIGHFENAKLILIGSGEDEAALRTLATTLGIADTVIFAGPRPDVPELLKCLTLFVSSSRWEGLPTVVLEAMAAGAPILATDIPGTRELVRNGENGWLVPPNDPTALAHRLQAALTDAEQRQILATRARLTAQAYAIEPIAAQHEMLYRRLWTQHHSPPTMGSEVV